MSNEVLLLGLHNAVNSLISSINAAPLDPMVVLERAVAMLNTMDDGLSEKEKGVLMYLFAQSPNFANVYLSSRNSSKEARLYLIHHRLKHFAGDEHEVDI